jgi:acid phosphatase
MQIAVLLALIAMAVPCLLLKSAQAAESDTMSNEHIEISESQTPTSVANLQSLRFVTIGDTGSGLKGQMNIAEAMTRYYQTSPFPLLLMVGDNIYPVGDVEKYGESRFSKPYEPLLSKGVAFKPVLGNHDVMLGNGPKQIDFFKMPGRYYTFTRNHVAFFAIDSTKFDTVQQQWLDRSLKQSKATWKVVYGHHPVFSSGLHGSSSYLGKTLKPILERNNVDLYLSGHDHNYERFAPVNGVTYIVTGGGGASLREFRGVEKGSLKRQSIHHFTVFHVIGPRLTMEAFDAHNQMFDTLTLSKLAATRQRYKSAS